MRSYRLQSVVVRVWAVLYVWSLRHYERERFREVLWRIRRQMAADRRRLGPGGGDLKDGH